MLTRFPDLRSLEDALCGRLQYVSANNTIFLPLGDRFCLIFVLWCNTPIHYILIKYKELKTCKIFAYSIQRIIRNYAFHLPKSYMNFEHIKLTTRARNKVKALEHIEHPGLSH